MLPYEDLLRALTDWRGRQGLPPLHDIDYLGELRLNRIDTSTAIAAVTGALSVDDLNEAGADYDDPIAPPPSPSGESWGESYDDPYSNDFEVEEDPYAASAPESAPADGYQQPVAPASLDVGDATAMFQELAPSQSVDYAADPVAPPPAPVAGYDSYPADAAAGYQDPAAAYQDPAAAYQDPAAAYQDPAAGYQNPAGYPNVGETYRDPAAVYEVPDNDGESTMIGGMPQPSSPYAAELPPAAPPPSAANAGQATAIFDTSLATQAAAALGAEYAIDGGVPSEPVYDSMAAQAEYQAERIAEQQAVEYRGQNEEHTYVAGGLSDFQQPPPQPATQQFDAAVGFDAGGYDAGGYDAPDLQPPPLAPPPAPVDDGSFDFPFSVDDEFGDGSQ